MDLNKDDIRSNILKEDEEPIIIGKPGPTAKTIREMMAKVHAKLDIEDKDQEKA